MKPGAAVSTDAAGPFWAKKSVLSAEATVAHPMDTAAKSTIADANEAITAPELDRISTGRCRVNGGADASRRTGAPRQDRHRHQRVDVGGETYPKTGRPATTTHKNRHPMTKVRVGHRSSRSLAIQRPRRRT